MIEPSIQFLRNHTDEPTKQMLDHLVDRKRKFEKYKLKCFRTQFFTFVLIMGFIVYLYAFIIKPTGGQMDVVLHMIFDNEMHIFFILLIVAGYATAQYFKKKEDKAETEYHNLRCEVIRKSTELWPQPAQWQNRHEVFTMMKKEFDINLFHESK
ncbi:YpbF family protein [Metabacillus niabensis]|uniref:YpbF family protein n=1 Tax=Metabacillus niabensis TaxID=324854 RepID=UPI001CFA44CB|nr:YpbF family protein [Metabacillus niabensis]